MMNVNGYTHTVNAAAYLDAAPEAIKSALLRSNSAFASVLPEILVDSHGEPKGAELVKIERGQVAIVTSEGVRFKIVSSSTDRFNVAPSFTKGYGRDSLGVSAKAYLSRNYDYVILVNTKDKENLKCRKVKVSRIEDNVIKVDV